MTIAVCESCTQRGVARLDGDRQVGCTKPGYNLIAVLTADGTVRATNGVNTNHRGSEIGKIKNIAGDAVIVSSIGVRIG